MSPHDDDALIPTGELLATEALATTNCQTPAELPPGLMGSARGGEWGLGRYRDLQPHARGGLGEVYVAIDTQFDRRIALKEIQERWRGEEHTQQRFLREARLTGKLEHPGIVPVYSLGRIAADRPYYAMRFIEGQSLAAAIATLHAAELDSPAFQLELRKLLRRLGDVCNTLEYAHAQGVVHRDIKPHNIMLGSFGETLVVDWGLAFRPMEAAEIAGGDGGATTSSASGPTLAGDIVGTPAYMSPEQAAGEISRLGPPSDVFSLGATLYQLLTSRAPVDGVKLVDLPRVLACGDFPRPRDINRRVPPPLEAICLKALAPQPKDRYASARALGEDLEKWLADEPVSAHRESLVEHSSRLARRHRAWVTAGMLALVLVSAVSVAAAVVVERARATESVARKEAQRQAAQSNFDAGELALQRGRWRKSRELFQKALDGGYPDPIAAKLGLVEAGASLGLSEDVDKLLAELRASDVGPHRGRLLLLEADQAFAANTNREAGLAQMRAALAGNLLNAAQREYVQGALADTFPKAIEHLEASLAIDPFQPHTRMLLILMYIMSGRSDDVRRQLQMYALIAPEDVNIHAGYAILAAYEGDLPAAQAELAQLRGHLDDRDVAVFKLMIEIIDEVLAGSAQVNPDDRSQALMAHIVASWPKFAAIAARQQPRKRHYLYSAPNHPALIRLFQMAVSITWRSLIPGAMRPFYAEMADINPDAANLFALHGDRYRSLNFSAAVEQGRGHDPELLQALHEIERGLQEASGKPSLFAFSRREALQQLIDVQATLGCDKEGFPNEAPMRDATLASIRRLLVEHPSVTGKEIVVLAISAAGVGRPLFAQSLIEEFAPSLNEAERLALYETQLLIAGEEQDPWHLIQAADRLLAIQPDHKRALQLRPLAILRLRQELARLSQE